ncbi:MAG: hypothetical protein EB072_07960 [Betaproteobacteria bacterium]|nr:hypothetical protein [Betaproteobacteria bacterium]
MGWPQRQNYIVENKPGAGNLIGIETVARAPADGYTLLFVASPLVLNPILFKKVNYDPIKDFSPISLAATAWGKSVRLSCLSTH